MLCAVQKKTNKRAHDLNEEIKINTQTATTGFFSISSYLNLSTFLQYFHARRRNGKTKIKW